MTAPDDGMEEALRRALTEAVSQIEPGTDGLERIRARIGARPPRPWLLSFAADAVGLARHWVWKGHWAWHWSWAWPTPLPATIGISLPRLPGLPRLPLPRLRRLPQRSGLRRPHPARSARTARTAWPVTVGC